MVTKNKHGKGVLSLVKRGKYCKIYQLFEGRPSPTSNKEGDPRKKAVFQSDSFYKNIGIISNRIFIRI